MATKSERSIRKVWRCQPGTFYIKKKFDYTKELEAENRIRTDNTIAKRKMTKRNIIYKLRHITLQIEKHEPNTKPVVKSFASEW